MKKQPIIGTITRAFDGVLDGIPARLIRVRRLGYTVELSAAKGSFHKGEILHLSLGEFIIDHADSRPPDSEDGKP